MKKIKIALFHPWIKSRGGAEKVVLEIMKIEEFDIDLYTWIYEPEKTFEEFKNFKIKVIAPKGFNKVSRKYFLRGFFIFAAFFSKIPLEKYEKFLITTSGIGEFITFRNYKKGSTYAYVFTPLRASDEDVVKWNLRNRYKKIFDKAVYLLTVKIYNFFEKISWKRLDLVIFLSELGRRRAIKKGLLKNKKHFIAYPLFGLEEFKKNVSKKNDFFLYVSRFSPDKRQKILIKAWSYFIKKYPDEKLVLAGSVENENYFDKILEISKKIPNITIKRDLSDNELKKLYSECKAGIFIPFMEDFGIVPFEVLAAGKPLIATDNGGYVELIKNNPGVFFIKEQNDDKMVEDLSLILEKFISNAKDGEKIGINNIELENFGGKIRDILIK